MESDFWCSKKDVEVTRESRRSVIGDAIYDLRFLAMDEKEFSLNVATSGLLTAEEIVPIYTKFNGIYSPGLKWKLSEKRSMNDKISDKRCVPMSDDLELENEQIPAEGYFYRMPEVIGTKNRQKQKGKEKRKGRNSEKD